MSLFAEQRILEIRLDGASPGNEGSEVLCDIAAHPVPDLLLMITTTKLDARSLSTKWVSAIDKQGVIIQVWPVELPQLPAWVDRRMQRAGLRPESGVASLIAERVEGNLLAAQQEIDKQVLLNPDGVVTTEAVTSNVADSARYDVLQLGLAAMQGQSSRALRILDGLREEGVDATLVLWGVNKDLQWMAQVAAAAFKSQSVDSAIQAAGVWRPRQNAMKQALQRLKLGPLRALLFDAAQVDAAIKGVNRRDPWVELRGLIARMSGVKLARARVA
jgi:DNA polymerase-3 subunit delta